MRYPKATKEALTAPPAQYRVLGVEINSTSESVFSIGDFDSLDAAKQAAKQKAGTGRSPTNSAATAMVSTTRNCWRFSIFIATSAAVTDVERELHRRFAANGLELDIGHALRGAQLVQRPQ